MGVDLPNHPAAAFWKVQHELANPWMVAVYAVAMIAICWHFAYGVWLFAAKWGITPGETARKRFAYVCLALGVLLAVMGLASIWAFIGPNYQNAPQNPALSWMERSENSEQRSALNPDPETIVAKIGTPLAREQKESDL